MTLNMKNRRAGFFELNTLIHELICVKKNLYSSSIKITMEPLQWEKNVWREPNQSLNQFKKIRRKYIEDLVNCALTLFFF